MKTTKAAVKKAVKHTTKAGAVLPPPVAPVGGVIDTTTPKPADKPVAPVVASFGAVPENVLFDGLSVTFKQGTTLNQWQAVLTGLVQATKVSQWCLGDALNFGAVAFKKDYGAAVKATGLANGTLRTAASIAKRFAPDKRRADISFEHHRLLAPLKDDAKVAEIMDKVTKDGLSAKAMAELIPKGEVKEKTPAQLLALKKAEDDKQHEHAAALLKYLDGIPADFLHTWAGDLHVLSHFKFAKVLAEAQTALRIHNEKQKAIEAAAKKASENDPTK